MTDLADIPHRRFNPLIGRHVLVSPHRAKRPWLGQADPPSTDTLPRHDPSCYLCPGNTRAEGPVNPDYDGAWLFDNDFPALLAPDQGAAAPTASPLFQHELVSGRCRVLCFSPDHSASLPDLTPAAMQAVITAWREETASLGADHAWVQIFENKGAIMGCSNPHPHGQIWATSFLPDEALAEDAARRCEARGCGRGTRGRQQCGLARHRALLGSVAI
jgi:UDPglucose--hexose-1-phosphate uridylyltransferase